MICHETDCDRLRRLIPGPGHPCSSYLVEAGGYRLLIDFGTGALGELQKHVDPHLLDAIVVTHLHPDHFFDTCGYAVMRRYSPGVQPEPIPLYGPTGVADRIVAAYGGQGSCATPHCGTCTTSANSSPAPSNWGR
ncbi:hypothetical protein GCM10029992_01390 [Glycomyces albus]